MRSFAIGLALLLCACAASPPKPAPEADAAIRASDPLIDDVRILSDDAMQGRAPGTPGSAMARGYIEDRLAEIGVDPVRDSYEQPFIFTTKSEAHEGTNVVGRIEGTARNHARRVLVVSAHYDHLGMANGQIFNGADDNASGVATLLAVAQAFDEPPRHDVIFAVVDVEEEGLKGARVLLSDPPVQLADMVLDVNLDMLSKNDRNELYAAGAAHWPFMQGRLEALAKSAPVTLKLGHDTPAWGEGQDWTTESDHAAFDEKGIPWVYFGVEDNPDYHTPRDRFSTIPQDFFRRSAATVVSAVRAFDDDLDGIAKDAGR